MFIFAAKTQFVQMVFRGEKNPNFGLFFFNFADSSISVDLVKFEIFEFFLFTRLYFIFKVGCISPMVIGSELRIGQYKHDGHREDAPHFTIWLSKNSLIKPNWSYFIWAEMTNHHSVGSENDRFRFPVWNWNYLRIVRGVSDRDA